MSDARRHDEFRELISARLDGQLSVLAERRLARHLLACAECRAVQNDYYEQRRRLRGLPALQPPRDLWARTSAALDREVVRRSWFPPAMSQPRRVPRAAIAGSAAALGLALVLASNESGLSPRPEQPDALVSPRSAVLPTPFGVAPQRMTLLGSDANGLVLYRAQVDQVCPASALACLGEEDLSPQIMSLPRDVSASNMSVSPDGERLAMTGRLRGRDGVFAFVLPDADAPTEPPTGAHETPIAAVPTDHVPSPGDTTLLPADTPLQADTPLPAHTPLPADTPLAPEGSPTAKASSAAETPPPAEASRTPQSASPAETSPPAETPTATLAVAESPIAEPEPTAAAALAAVTILEDVQMAGAPPAWSPSGELLAFSAMPANGSRGPDIYVWREGEEMAEPLTSDHASYFASWAGERILASRLVEPDEPGQSQLLRTVVIDLASGEEREVDLTDIWLPHVSPDGRHAVVWQGSLETSAAAVEPQRGALYLTDWKALDPFLRPAGAASADASEPAADEADGGEANETASADETAAADETASADEAASADETASADHKAEDNPSARPSAKPAATAEPSQSLEPDPDAGTPDPAQSTAEPTAQPEPTTAPAHEPQIELLPLDAQRDPVEEPVVDWQVRWSSDGSVVGYWVADASGASWGQLAVLSVTSTSEGPAIGEPLLGPTLARRSFTLGINRVAWVGAAESQPDGEVRIRTWGPGGEGGLSLPTLDLREVVPGF